MQRDVRVALPQATVDMWVVDALHAAGVGERRGQYVAARPTRSEAEYLDCPIQQQRLDQLRFRDAQHMPQRRA